MINNQIHRSGICQASAEDKYYRYGYCCRMREAQKRILGRNKTYQNAKDEPQKSDHVITDSSPDK
jgi:hypothetical protein